MWEPKMIWRGPLPLRFPSKRIRLAPNWAVATRETVSGLLGTENWVLCRDLICFSCFTSRPWNLKTEVTDEKISGYTQQKDQAIYLKYILNIYKVRHKIYFMGPDERARSIEDQTTINKNKLCRRLGEMQHTNHHTSLKISPTYGKIIQTQH